MVPEMAAAIGLSTISGLQGLVGSGSNLGFGIEDRQFRQKVYDETKEREDSAVQRRVKDLAKAGLSPLSDFGTGASASAGGSSIPVLQNFGDFGAGATNALGNTILDTQKTEAQIANMNADTSVKIATQENIKEATSKMISETKLTDEKVKNMSLENKLLEFEAQLKTIDMPDEYRKELIATMKKPEMENKLLKADTVKKYSDVVNDSIRTGCAVSDSVRKWFYFWQK